MRRIKSIPDAVRVTDGLRHTGYTPETAIADLIDNSIAANAELIGVRLSRNYDETYTVWVGDNGCGMNEETLIQAMQYGSSKQLARNSLSVYGLGMKMASTSFSRRFTVVTRELGNVAFAATYDLDEMADHPWTFVVGLADEMQITALDEVAEGGCGTVVIWEKADFRISEQSPKKKRAVGKPKNLDKEIETYLGLVFHRFMDGVAENGKKIQIKINGNQINSWNPVNPDYLDKEWIPTKDTFFVELERNGEIEKIPYVLKTYKLNGELDEPNKPGAFESSRVGMALQGIYPYRENRILQKPSWLNVLTFHPDTNTMRVVLELDPRLDEVIHTDVKKSGIALSDEMWEELKNVLEIYKAGIKKIVKERSDKRKKKRDTSNSNDIHKASNTIINTASPDLPNPSLKRISPTTVEVDTLFGPSITEIRDATGPLSRDSRIQVVDSLDGGFLWEPVMRGADQVILLNKSHPFYQKIYLNLRQNPLATQGLDFMLYSLANAEWMTRTDRAKEQFTQMRIMMANTLRTLVSELEIEEDSEYDEVEFDAES